jgi:iron complex transport system permease protein
VTRVWAPVIVTALAASSLFLAVACGSYPLSLGQTLQGLLDPASGTAHDIVWQLRAPRAFAAFACGGLLALAGALLQVLLRNPLADPYVLGISGGASLAALIALALGARAAIMEGAALGGALAAIALVYLLSYDRAGWNAYRVLLTGVVLSAGLSALISFILVMAPPAEAKGMLYWLMGDLSDAGHPLASWIVLIVLTAAGVALAVQLDLLMLGETKARTLGVGVTPLQAGAFFGAAVATVAAVTLGGAIGFVGLMTPHALRIAGVVRHRLLLPLSVLLGGSLLTLADTAARTLWAPQQLPVGVLMALLGVPAMLLLLSRAR